jgi:glycosyltransferase involved in cell wall biosynthesis
VKIGYLTNQYPKISHSFIRREILALAANGLEITRFSVRPSPDRLVDPADLEEQQKTEVLLAGGVARLFIGMVRTAFSQPIAFFQTLKLTVQMGINSDRGLLRHFAYLAEACILRRRCQKLEISHLHVHFGTNPTAVALFCENLGGPSFSFTVHGPEEFDKPAAISLGRKIEAAKFVIAVSSFGKSQLYRWCGHHHWHKIHVIHCGVDDLFLNYPISPVPTEPRLVCVARLSEQKGHLLLLQAAASLAKTEVEFELVLVGDGELRSPIETFIAEHALQRQIKLIGWANSETVRHHILNSRAMVLPSFAEGLPVVIMEALALHRPVISTYIAGIPELVEPGKSGWLIPAGSVEELVVAMRSAILATSDELQAMGRLGSQKVKEQHNAAREATKLFALITGELQPADQEEPLPAIAQV